VVVHCKAQPERLRAAGDIAKLGGRSRALSFDVGDRAACAAPLKPDIAASWRYYGAICTPA